MKQNNDALGALDEVAKVIAYASYYDDDVDEYCKKIRRELEQAQKMREVLREIKLLALESEDDMILEIAKKALGEDNDR